ncbi:hypothetical protein [Fulvivirga ligni]|uniref:hypothetical protein n=1 Tax=Fulvivirga ligni TaxID=2904246 RepID=UPI001F187981|nr:hypothetical protein [Fulvivirga ligni]UII20480.1 hypothetical protein LVD16_21820 [Fulvivirga ligni]
MFKGIFKNRKKEPSKVETWKKLELYELFDDLDKAEKILSELSGGYSGIFADVEEFHREFVEELNDLKYQNVPDFEHICMWFAPTSAWDDFVGLDGIELGNRIYERANKWNNASV